MRRYPRAHTMVRDTYTRLHQLARTTRKALPKEVVQVRDTYAQRPAGADLGPSISYTPLADRGGETQASLRMVRFSRASAHHLWWVCTSARGRMHLRGIAWTRSAEREI